MAVLKSIKQKNKEFIFKSFDNQKSENPAKIIFNRFPLVDETFPLGNQKTILDSSIVKNFDNTQKSKEKLVEHIINTLVENITANRIDYKRFFSECVSHIEDLEYEGKEIKSVKDFIEFIPEEAFHTIAVECYIYAQESDRFSIEQKKI
jgi:hypothetical protein